MDDHGEVIDGGLLVSDLVDADLGVGHTAAVPRFDEGLVLLEAVATSRSFFIQAAAAAQGSLSVIQQKSVRTSNPRCRRKKANPRGERGFDGREADEGPKARVSNNQKR